MPALASPAMVSPATIATVIGRNTGSTSASAAAGNSWPLLTTADRNAPPRPGGGARSVTASSTATSAGSAHSSAQHSQTRRRRSSRLQLDARSRRASSASVSDPVRSVSRSAPAPPAPGCAAAGASSVTRMPAATSRAFSAAGSSWRTTSVVAVAVDDLPVQHGDDRGRVRGAHAAPARSGRAARSRSSVEHQPARVHHPDPVAQRLDLAEQVAGQHDGGAGLVQRDQQVAHLADAARVQAVGRLVEQQQLRARAAARRRCPAAAACPASRPAPGAGRSRPGRPARAPRRPARRRPRPPARVRPRRAGAGWPARTGAPTPPGPRPARRPGAAPARRAAASARRAARPRPRSACTSPSSIRTSVVLPEPLGPSSPNRTPAGTAQVDPVDGGDPAEPLGQAARDDHVGHARAPGSSTTARSSTSGATVPTSSTLPPRPLRTATDNSGVPIRTARPRRHLDRHAAGRRGAVEHPPGDVAADRDEHEPRQPGAVDPDAGQLVAGERDTWAAGQPRGRGGRVEHAQRAAEVRRRRPGPGCCPAAAAGRARRVGCA